MWRAAWCLVVTTVLGAQVLPKGGPVSVFDLVNHVEIREPEDASDAKVVITDLVSHKVRTLTAPRNGEVFDAYDGRLWMCEDRSTTVDRHRSFYSSVDGQHWQVEAVAKPLGRAPVLRAYPLSKGHWLLISMGVFEQDKQRSPFALGREGKGHELELDEILDSGLSKGLLAPNGTGKSETMSLADLPLAYLQNFVVLGVQGVIRTDAGLVIVSDRTGYIWLLHDKQGTASLDLVKLFPQADDRWLVARGPADVLVLGAQPRPNGHILIAARSEDYAFKARKYIDAPPQLMKDSTEADEKAEAEYQKKVTAAFPEVIWWDLDPQKGTFKQEPAPHGAPSRLSSPAAVENFSFIVDESDNVRILH